MKTIYLTALYLAVLSNTTLILRILMQTKLTAQRISFIVMILLINAWAIPQIILLMFNFTGDYFILVDKISALDYTFIPVVFFIFTLAYTHKLDLLKNYLTVFLVFMLSIVFIFLSWNTNLIESRNYDTIQMTQWGYAVPTGPLFIMLFIWFEGIVIYSLFEIIKFYKSSSDSNSRNQSILIIIATIIPLLFGTITNGILPALHIHIFPSAIPLTSIMAAIIAYAIIKYELFEFTSKTILSTVDTGIITLNESGIIKDLNRFALFMLKLKFSEAVGKKYSDIIKLKSFQITKNIKHKMPVEYVLTAGKQYVTNKLSISSEHKKNFPVELSIIPFFDQNKVIGAALSFRDITKEKEIEKSKNEFISIASHELKTPITAIKALSQILERKLKIEGNNKHIYLISKINQQIDKITKLINDLLNLNRIEEGNFALKKSLFDYDAMLRQLISDFKYTTPNYHILKTGLVSGKLYADKDKITQAIMNLLNNAVKYSPSNKKIILKVTKNKNNLITSIQDFGIGIDKNDQPKLFKRYFRSEISQEKKIMGFGLGLYICSEIIKKHKGKIWFESKLGKGTTFYISLPLNLHD